jgi:hypothetical protein
VREVGHLLKLYQATSTNSNAPWHMVHRTKTCGIRTIYSQCNNVTRLGNHCCHGNATTSSLRTVVDLQVAVSNLKPLWVATETQWLPSALLLRCKISYCSLPCVPTEVFTQGARHCCPTLTTLAVCREMLVKFPNTKFH